MTTLNQERYVGVEEAASFMCKGINWLYQNHKRLNIPSYYVGRKLVFKISELDSWIRNS